VSRFYIGMYRESNFNQNALRVLVYLIYGKTTATVFKDFVYLNSKLTTLKKLTLVFLTLLVFTACNNNQKKTEAAIVEEISTTYYLIRHAEKDRSNPENSNPELTAEGLQRAQNWAKHFEDIKIDQIYSTDYTRTMQTAYDVAKQKNIVIKSYDPSDMYNDDFKNATKGKQVLVVGHSNTTPQFVNAIIGNEDYTDIPDDENGLLYIVRVTGDISKVELLTID